MSKFYQDPATVSGGKGDYGIVEDPDLCQPAFARQPTFQKPLLRCYPLEFQGSKEHSSKFTNILKQGFRK